jgi:hypothetical protein
MRLISKIIIYGVAIALLLNTAYLVTAKKVVGYVVYEPETVVEETWEIVPYTDYEEFPEQVTVEAKDCRQEYVPFEVIDWKGTYECATDGPCAEYDLVCIEETSNGICKDYEKICKKKSCGQQVTICTVKLLNKWKEKGPFTIRAYFIGGEGKVSVDPITKMVDAHGIGEWKFEYTNAAVGEETFCDYNITKAPTYENCDVHKVTKTMNKMRQVVKYRNETHKKTTVQQKAVFQEREEYKYLR